ncbi:hypothetical protein QBC46DRAFT_345220 [Diplogelasinospora grovesii]|uniref:Uncharacterized protein n=1 Tax=Diplogelasinospora grovesii TaxID=303347 RepID=A0AAN6N0B5_9PEZI|nr:hypothetical protein QBC46DRAFT_345220 [Diplogelasinospora grovesii]
MEEVDRYVFLHDCMVGAGLCQPCLKSALTVYLKSLDVGEITELAEFMPRYREIYRTDFVVCDSSFLDIGLNERTFAEARYRPRHNVIMVPDRFYDWFLKAASRAARKYNNNDRASYVEAFDFKHVENALFVAAMARLTTIAARLTETPEMTWSVETQRLYREGWKGVFNLLQPPYEEECMCNPRNPQPQSVGEPPMIPPEDHAGFKDMVSTIKEVTEAYIDDDLGSEDPIDPEALVNTEVEKLAVNKRLFDSHWKNADFIKMLNYVRETTDDLNFRNLGICVDHGWECARDTCAMMAGSKGVAV